MTKFKFPKKGDIGYSYILMIVLGILGLILVLYIWKGGFGPVSNKLLNALNQTQP